MPGWFTTGKTHPSRPVEVRILKGLAVLLSFLCLLVPSQASSQEIYGWIDERGKVYIVDDINQVPEHYRDGVRTYHPSPGLRNEPPVEKREIPEPVSKIPGKPEETEVPILGPEEDAARIETLNQREKDLEEERVRQKALQNRFSSSTVRSTLYKKRVQEIDQEIEAIQKELEAIRLKGQ